MGAILYPSFWGKISWQIPAVDNVRHKHHPAHKCLVYFTGPSLELLLFSYLISHRVAVDVWSMLADFCNILTAVNQSEVPLYKDPDDDLTLLILEEDRLLSGFVPLLAAPQDPCYVEKTSDKVSPRPNITPHSPFLLILQTFLFLGSFLCKRNMIKSLRRVLRENIDLLAADI